MPSNRSVDSDTWAGQVIAAALLQVVLPLGAIVSGVFAFSYFSTAKRMSQVNGAKN